MAAAPRSHNRVKHGTARRAEAAPEHRLPARLSSVLRSMQEAALLQIHHSSVPPAMLCLVTAFPGAALP